MSDQTQTTVEWQQLRDSLSWPSPYSGHLADKPRRPDADKPRRPDITDIIRETVEAERAK